MQTVTHWVKFVTLWGLSQFDVANPKGTSLCDSVFCAINCQNCYGVWPNK